jgi:hypothetical protein
MLTDMIFPVECGTENVVVIAEEGRVDVVVVDVVVVVGSVVVIGSPHVSSKIHF